MTTKRRTYTDEFKREAVRLWGTTDKTAATIEAELGITPGLLKKWKQRLKANGDATFPGRGRLTADEEKIRNRGGLLQLGPAGINARLPRPRRACHGRIGRPVW